MQPDWEQEAKANAKVAEERALAMLAKLHLTGPERERVVADANRLLLFWNKELFPSLLKEVVRGNMSPRTIPAVFAYLLTVEQEMFENLDTDQE